jgi:hypothetical protein
VVPGILLLLVMLLLVLCYPEDIAKGALERVPLPPRRRRPGRERLGLRSPSGGR